MGHALPGGELQGLSLELASNISINDLEERVECAFNRIADVDKLEWSGLDHSCCEAAQLGLVHAGDEAALEAPNGVSPPSHLHNYWRSMRTWSHGLHNGAWWTRKNGTS